MQCLASATASSFSSAMVERVDRDMMGKSARLAYMPAHQLARWLASRRTWSGAGIWGACNARVGRDDADQLVGDGQRF